MYYHSNLAFYRCTMIYTACIYTYIYMYFELGLGVYFVYILRFLISPGAFVFPLRPHTGLQQSANVRKVNQSISPVKGSVVCSRMRIGTESDVRCWRPSCLRRKRRCENSVATPCYDDGERGCCSELIWGTWICHRRQAEAVVVCVQHGGGCTRFAPVDAC